MTQKTNDQLIANLQPYFFHKRREVWLLDNNDVRPNNDGRGLAHRFINPIGLEDWTAHFRTGDAPGAGELAAYSWINDGTFTGGPAAVVYSQGNDYLAASGVSRYFLARTITNAAANWQNKHLYGRFRTGAVTEIGLRYDTGADGTANEFYVELIVQPIAGAGGTRYDVALRYRINGAAAVTTLAGLNVPGGDFIVLHLLSYWSGAALSGRAYLVSESGTLVSTGMATAALTAYYPQAGRAGLYLAGNGNYAECDWFYTDFS